MKHALVSLAFALAASSATSQTCPPAPDHADAISSLIQSLQEAKDSSAAHMISNQMWSYWADAPDAYAQELLDEAISRRTSYDYDGAMLAIEGLIAHCPDYAEGYNQRAFVNFLRGDYDAALPDLERAVQISPRHIAAMTGQAMTLMALKRNAEAALTLRAALALNPWLSERSLLPVLEQYEDTL
ncbi:tetratricopeptide repeat protein [Rhodobacteraceae bacterium KMM 6894]|nr:tetratricopeptide repeat protein [Rhodobacteraceae bacterium KMM 6894]